MRKVVAIRTVIIRLDRLIFSWLVGWLVGFMAYQSLEII